MKLNIFHYLIFFPGTLFMAFVAYKVWKYKNRLGSEELEKILNILEKYLTHLQYKRRFWSSDDNFFPYTFYGKNNSASFEIICKNLSNYLIVEIFNVKAQKTTQLRFTLFLETGLDFEDFEKQVSSHLT